MNHKRSGGRSGSLPRARRYEGKTFRKASKDALRGLHPRYYRMNWSSPARGDEIPTEEPS